MLETLSKIGEQLLEGKGIWAQLTSEPKFTKEKTNWVCPILFDCDTKQISILKDAISRFQLEDSIIHYRYLNTELWGRRGKKCALTVEPKNFSMLEETLFGKSSNDSGSMTRTIEEFPRFLDTPIYMALKEIKENLDSLRNTLNLAEIKKELNFGKGDDVVLFYTEIKSEKINNGEQIKLIDLDGYEEFVLEKFGPKESGEEGIDYVSGNVSKNVQEANFSGRYNIHKIFQTTASNYASGFGDFKKNFQTDRATVTALDKASDYVLDNSQTKIAGISHIVIPNFLHKDLKDFSVEETEIFLDKSSELLFKYQSLDASIQRELPDSALFWVNYLAFESDGNSFKVINHIKDVNSKYLRKLISQFAATEIEFKKFIGEKSFFNFLSVYYSIPVRDGSKSKNNPALHLFKDILEQRNMELGIFHKYFAGLLICHRNGQFDDRGYHRAFPNIKKGESFENAVKDAVFKYLALIKTLNNLKLLKMKNSELSNFMEKYPHPVVSEFLELKNCNRNQLALFCLGRALNVIGYAQERKKHPSRPILNKLNFNGMEWIDVKNLTSALWEKSVQYQIVYTAKGNEFKVRKTVEEWLDLFSKYAQEEDWSLSKEETLFYLMTGYVFRPSSEKTNENSDNN